MCEYPRSAANTINKKNQNSLSGTNNHVILLDDVNIIAVPNKVLGECMWNFTETVEQTQD